MTYDEWAYFEPFLIRRGQLKKANFFTERPTSAAPSVILATSQQWQKVDLGYLPPVRSTSALAVAV
jgi:hypothetical protein